MLYAIFIESFLKDAPVTDTPIAPTGLVFSLCTSYIDMAALPAFLAWIMPSEPPLATLVEVLEITYTAFGLGVSRYFFGSRVSPVNISNDLYVSFNEVLLTFTVNVPTV